MKTNAIRHTRWLAALVLVAVLLPVALMRAQRAESPEQMLQRAIHKEVIEGDPKAALDLYKQVIDAPRASEAVKAQAMLNTGRSHDSLGNDAEARAAYERVIRNFRSQSAMVVDANVRLVALGAVAPGTAVTLRGLTKLPISGIRLGAVSPDGRYVYTEHGIVVDQVTGRRRQIPETPASIFDAAFSSDGAQIAYEVGREDPPNAQIRVVSLRAPDGTNGTVLFRNEEYVGGRPFGWSSDGKQVFAVLARKDGTYVIAAISTADRTFRPIKSLDWRWPTGLSLSPDGHYISYDLPLGRESIDRDIFVLSTDGRLDVPLVQGPGRDAGPVWTPDGKAVVFASDREGAPGLWMIEVTDGTPRGTAVNLRRNETLRPIGFTRDGSLYYVRAATGRIGDRTLYTADVELEVGTGSRSEMPIGLAQDRAGRPSYSPDGRRLAYVSFKLPTFAGPYPFQDYLPTIVVRTLSTGEEREIPATFVWGLEWMPDGKSVVFQGNLHSDPTIQTLHRIDLDTGKDLMGQVPPLGDMLRVSPDGKTIYYLKSKAIMAYDVGTQRKTELHRGDLTGNLAVSPDGQQIVFGLRQPGNSAQLHVMSTLGGTPRALPERTPSGNFGFVEWLGNGKSLLVQRGNELWSIPMDGGTPQRVGKDTYPSILSLRPDGQQIVVARGSLPTGPSLFLELWADPHVLPNHERFGIFLANIDRAGSRVHGPVVSVSPSFISSGNEPTWSPDGKSIAFSRLRGDAMICEETVLAAETAVERVYRTYVTDRSCGGRATWFHDSKGFLLQSNSSFVRFPVDGQTSRQIAKPVVNGSGPSALSTDDTILYVVAYPVNDQPHIVVVDLTTGAEKQRFAFPASASVRRVGGMALSPDGRTLALSVNDGSGIALNPARIVRIGTDGKDYRELFRPAERGSLAPRGPVWSADGSAVLVGVYSAPPVMQIMRIPAVGGSRGDATFTGLEVTSPVAGVGGFDLSPDGTRIVFAGKAPTIAAAAR